MEASTDGPRPVGMTTEGLSMIVGAGMGLSVNVTSVLGLAASFDATVDELLLRDAAHNDDTDDRSLI